MTDGVYNRDLHSTSLDNQCSIEKKNNYYTWADKIVYDPKKESEVKNAEKQL